MTLYDVRQLTYVPKNLQQQQDILTKTLTVNEIQWYLLSNRAGGQNCMILFFSRKYRNKMTSSFDIVTEMWDNACH